MKRAFWIPITLGTVLLAQEQSGPSADPNANDNSRHAVARISLVQGVVNAHRGDSGEATAAVVNAPLSATDRLLTGEGSRSEIQFDALNMIRLAPSTEVRIGELAYHHYQVQIATGTTLFRVMRDNDAEIEISTPSIAVHPLKKGIYRITVKADGSSEVTVRQGEAEIFSPKGSEKLGSGKTMEARGSASDPEFHTTGAIASDQWDSWNNNRDHDLERAGGGRYMNPDINGAEELETNGRWVEDPAYGQVWVPNADPGWAPYQVGRWVWEDYYGWTWVSADPWGWAPYHYGRWYMGPYGWAWWPGAISGPCYWQPALVGFFGWGGFGVGFGFGNIGWVPLAPYERFYPGYGVGFGAGVVVRNVNAASVYRNARVANGVTSVNASEFGRASVSRATSVRATAADLSHTGSVRGSLPVAPSRESTRFSSAPVGAVRTSPGSSFYSRSGSTGAATHQSFEQQRQTVARNASRVTPAAPAAGAASTARLSGPATSTSQSTNSVSTRSAAPAAQTQTQTQSWQKFGGNNSGAARGSTPTAGRAASPVRINPSVVQGRSTGSSSSSAPRSGGGASSAPRSSGSSSRGGGGGRR